MIISILFLALIGFLISCYAYFIERQVVQDHSYKPACDISDRVSCTKALTSPYANLFFMSNSFAGMLFYACVAITAYFDWRILLMVLSVGSVVASLILGYLLYFKIKAICLVCTSLYIINALLLFLSYRNLH